MSTRIRTLNFLPEVFQTKTNAEFLAATLDQLVNPPLTTKIQGYVGSKVGYGVNANDYYVTEPTKVRDEYQLEPGVIFTNKDQSTAKDFISYPGMLDALDLEGGVIDNNSRLFESQIYSWDSFVDLDKVVNYNQYYWAPTGLPAVTVSSALVYSANDYIVTDLSNGYNIREVSAEAGSINPTITLLRGGTYRFFVNQPSHFWIQGEPGVSGFSNTQINIPIRDVFGVENNGATSGVVTFTVPREDAQDDFIFPGDNKVDVISTLPFSQVNGATLSQLGSIDGITSLDGLRVMFYDTNPETTFFRITYTGDLTDPTILLTPDGTIPPEEKITVLYGTTWINRGFYRNTLGVVSLIPYITAPLDQLYYQDGTTANKVGIIKIINSNLSNTINVEVDILGKKTYTATNGVVFTNGLKVQFDGDVIPSSYLTGEYYVEGVGKAIELVPVESLVVPEKFSQGLFIPYDSTPYDSTNYDADLFIPVEADYITIARNSITKNAWSRSNRWFHVQVINQTAVYNNNPAIVTTFTKDSNKAKRPILEFYPNLKLFDSGIAGKAPVDFYDTKETDALSNVAGLLNYFPDVETYSTNTATITSTITAPVSATTFVPGVTYQINTLGNTSWNVVAGTFAQSYVIGQKIVCVNVGTGTGTATPLATTSTIEVNNDQITGKFEEGMYVGDTTNLLPVNSQITNISVGETSTTLTVVWPIPQNISGTTEAGLAGADRSVDNYSIFTGARIVFSKDENPLVRNKIYVVRLTTVINSSAPVITLVEALDGNCEEQDQIVVLRGYNYEGKSFYLDTSKWVPAQEKVTVNQPPLFDVFDSNGISFSDDGLYQGSSFKGCKLLAYEIGSGPDDPILGFPVRYSSIDNIGDISFDVHINTDTFDYVSNQLSITEKVNTGYVYNYSTREDYTRNLGWQTAAIPSVQYQVFQFVYDGTSDTFTCDVPAILEASDQWPPVQVFINNNCQCKKLYTYGVVENNTTIEILNASKIEVNTPIEVMVLSKQVSKQAYYTIPVNLSNNPFNQELEKVSVGDIRQHYRDIYVNAPAIVGQVFGSNNYRDLGNLVPYGTKIIQNSASLALPGTFLRKTNFNIFDALRFNSNEYIKFKNLLVDTINNAEYVQRFTPAEILDKAFDTITQSKSEASSFFWSDMVPAKSTFRTNTYTFANDLETSNFPLTTVYDFDSANYNSVLIYLTRTIEGVQVQKQLIKDFDYTVSKEAPSVTVTLPLIAGDKVTVKEYNQTYGNYVPNTPTKLGLYPAFKPEVVLDSAYSQPTYFIRGHDGSYNRLYGSYIEELGVLEDFRDQGLLEFELRIYNNLKISTQVPVPEYEIVPGFFRNTDYSYDEYLQVYSEGFLNWVGQNRLDYKTQSFSRLNEFTFNYSGAGNKVNAAPIDQGYWRGMYRYFYDTTTPDKTPWEMLGFTEQPTWWTHRYGPAPYTSDNEILWTDLEKGIIWNNGDPIKVEVFTRPGLTKIIPVDSAGKLVTPFAAIMGNYNPNTFQKDWKVGDCGPVEFSYLRSSSYPFDLMRITALFKPAKFFSLGVDLDNYKYNTEFNQYLVNARSHLLIDQLDVYGSGKAKTSYMNWLVDFEKQFGIDATNEVETILNNLDVRLVYRIAGYSDKDLLKFFVEKGTPNSKNASLLVPDESYSLLLYDNQPFDRIVFSSVVVQLTTRGYSVFGNSQTNAYFKILKPLNNGKYDNIEVEGVKVKVAIDYTKQEVLVPYGAELYSEQELAQFLASYGAYLKAQGVVFDSVYRGIEVSWDTMIQEFLYWAQTGWEIGSLLVLNPSAQTLKINKENAVVQPLAVLQNTFVLNQNLYPIQAKDMSITRDDTMFSVTALNQGDAVAFGQFNLGNFEHAVVFDNITLFNDTIYNLVTGLRQSRVYVRGTKTADWNGTVTASGFILNQDNIKEWVRTAKYTKGSIVLFKNKYWTSLKVIEPTQEFNEKDWKETDYDQIQKGLLPNSSTRSYESALYYNTDQANLEKDADLLGYSLIGYRPRDYMAIADLTDVTQVNVYQNMIKNKGTRNAVEAFKGAYLVQGGIEYDVYENWAIKTTEYGGTLNKNFVEFKINEDHLTGNPAIFSLTSGTYTEGSQQEVPIYSLFNYNRPIDSPDILSTIDPTTPAQVYPDAGYTSFDDVKMASYFYSGLSEALDKNNEPININNFYVRDYAWLANYLENWEVLVAKPVGRVVAVRSNLNRTATITFDAPHGLSKRQPLSIINYSTRVDGYYIISDVVSLTEVTINLVLASATQSTGQGIGLTFQSQRVAKPSDINTLDLLEAEFVKNTVWVDAGTSGSWEVYRKSLNYTYDQAITKPNSESFGKAVAYTPRVGYLVSDPEVGEDSGQVYRYVKRTQNDQYSIKQTLAGGESFGSKIVYAGNMYIISEPTTDPSVHVYVINDSKVTNDLILCQTIAAPTEVTNWGSETAISNDTNWLYISDTENNRVYVYRKQNIPLQSGYFVSGETYVITDVGDTDFTLIGAVESAEGIVFVATGAGVVGTGTATQITYKYSTFIDAPTGILSGDNFSKSLATNYNGDLLIVGAPDKDYDPTIENWGSAYAYSRSVQNIESQFSSTENTPRTFQLAWAPSSPAARTSTQVSSNYIVADGSMTGFSINDPVIFTGNNFGDTGIIANKVYYIQDISGSTIAIKESRNTNDPLVLQDDTGLDINIFVQISPLTVSINGKLVHDNVYGIVNATTFLYTGTLLAGDIINISGSLFDIVQSFNSQYTNRVGTQFGFSLDTTYNGSEVLIGSPFEISPENQEGAVYRYTNAGAKFGLVLGVNECNLTVPRTLLINGYAVNLPAGDATVIASTINSARITNIQAAASDDNKIIIQLIDSGLAPINQKLVITPIDDAIALSELGLEIFANTQIIMCPHPSGPTQFGSVVKFNEHDSVVISAPVATRYEGTTFDFIDDEDLRNDTIFDNNATRFIDTASNAGAVYMFDYIANYSENLTNLGEFIYAQSLNSKDSEYGFNPSYGQAIDFNANRLIIGAPNYLPESVDGQITIYENLVGTKDWSVYRSSAPVVDINKINNTQLFSAETNNTLVNLDYIDPLQGKLLGSVRQNIDYISLVDPANYNNPERIDEQSGMVWGETSVGKLWFDTSSVKFVNYHQNDVTYNSKYWGTVFPGSDVAVYTWISSTVSPFEYDGPGEAKDTLKYAVTSRIDSSGVIVPVYYFWVRNSNIVFRQGGKTLSDTILEQYISNPRTSGISFFAPLKQNTFALYNSSEYINANDTVFHIGFSTGTTDDIAHSEFVLIKEDFADDFLPGVPKLGSNADPDGLYDRFLDSLAGVDEIGNVVPNPYLPKAVQTGISARPQQSFFYNRYLALKNYLTYANEVLAQYPISEIRPDVSFLFASGEFFNTPDYWQYINWWAPGYDNSTRSASQVSKYADLATLVVAKDTIITVESNGEGKFEVYRYDGNGVWTRIGLENGTIEFKLALWDYAQAGIGYGNDFYDTTPFDSYPSEETRSIVRALCEQIYTEELRIFRNKSLILLFEYIQTESNESQNYLPWLNKTSLVDVEHTIRQLKPIQIFRADNQEFLAGYINEVKPYHVVIKEFVFKYTGQETYSGDITDFDLPAQYNKNIEQFITPNLVYSNPNQPEDYLDTDDIWQTAPYTQWFQNKGVSLTGQPNYEMTTLVSYMTIGSSFVFVDNARGFPINGVIKIGEEQIGYSSVDPALNLISGLIRGANGTTVTQHFPGERLFIDLPEVLVLGGGKGYTEPPKVTAYIDLDKYPAPAREAKLEAVMALDSVLSVNVIDPGQGYMVLPEIKIDPAIVVSFDNTNVNSSLHTVTKYAPNLATGDLVRYNHGVNGVGVGKLTDNQWYYVNVLEDNPSTVIAFYTSYSDAIYDHDRIEIESLGADTGMTISIGARAAAISSASPVRENNITLRFDRTSYQSRIKDWKSGVYYGSFFAGDYFNSERIASSSIKLESVLPPISSILASAAGVAFEIQEADNNRQLGWSSLERKISGTNSDNTIDLIPLDDGSINPNSSGSTIGFYVTMPIKFIGTVVGGLEEETTYYVKTIVSDTSFTVSLTPNSDEVVLTNAIVPVTGLKCFTGEVIDTATLTIRYPGIREVTNTNANINAITVPLTIVGTGGTQGMYTSLPVFFTGETFGKVRQNDPYYVTSVLDSEHFTISEKQYPTSAGVVSSSNITGIIVVNSTTGFKINDPIVFTDIVIAGNASMVWGNINSGQVYYVNSIVSDTELKISLVVNGAVLDPGTVVLSPGTTALITNQSECVKLTTATGSMTVNLSLPVSPGQIDGQLFTLYNTSQQYPDLGAAASDLISRTMLATIESVERIALDGTGGTENFYVNMPIQFTNSPIGSGLLDGTTYYITEYSGQPDPLNGPVPNIQAVIDSTSATGNVLICADGSTTDSFFVNMPIVFSGIGLGEIEIGVPYYVDTIVDSESFTIRDISGNPVAVTNDTEGTMQGSGSPYIIVSAIKGGDPVTLTTQVPIDGFTMSQEILSTAEFDVSYILGGYRALVSTPGEGYAVNNTLTITGDLLGGTTPANDLIMTVNTIDQDGGITDVICSGTVPGAVNKYYLKVISPNQVEVYSNPLLTIPVGGLDFDYTGYVTTEVLSVIDGIRLIVDDMFKFEETDQVVFTGNVSGTGITQYQTYYIVAYDVDNNFIEVGLTPGGSSIPVTGTVTGITMAKIGSYALLPEPFYFNQSIVKYNNRVYVCVVSNNDDEFIFGKWQLLDPADRRLNAMDRTVGYYQPTANMPGVDLTQLYSGVVYPNSTYIGNPFAPAKQYTVDTALEILPFYPGGINLTSVLWNGSNYLAIANLADYSAVLGSSNGETWAVAKLTNVGVGVSNVIQGGSLYVITTTNSATPILKSEDGAVWSAAGIIEIDEDESKLISAGLLSLNDIVYQQDLFVAVGSGIITSLDAYTWNKRLEFTGPLNNTLLGVTYTQLSAFTGFVAVGKGQMYDYSTGITETVDTNLVYYSTDGINWSNTSSVSNNGFFGVTTDDNTLVAVGEEGVIYYSENGADWLGVNEVTVRSINGSTDQVNVTNTAGFSVNDTVRFTNSFSSITANTTYYIIDIFSETQVSVSTSEGGPVLVLTDSTIPVYTRMYLYDAVLPNQPTLRSVAYGNGIFVTVGDNGMIKTSPDVISWTQVDSGVTEDIIKVTYKDSSSFIAVGRNNTILTTDDNGVSWTKQEVFTVAPPIYDIKGGEFMQGYAPEELVAGIVEDNLALTVTTRPGTNWPVSEYAHTGYTTVSLEIEPESGTQVVYSFKNAVQYPTEVSVALIDGDTGLSYTLYENIDYTIDWINDTIELINSIRFLPIRDKLRIDVYEVGNGDQLERSSSKVDPIRMNSNTGFNEIALNCNYSAPLFAGSGVIRPTTFPVQVYATATTSLGDRILCDDVKKFVLNQSIRFQGTTLGGIVENQQYFVKSISYATNSITISATQPGGIAGPIFDLTDDTGLMLVNIAIGSGLVWSEPAVYHNGNKLVLGQTNIAVRTKSSTNTVVTVTNDGLVAGSPIEFCLCMFEGSNINPLTTYYIKDIIGSTEFTISDTPFGPVKVLGNATGRSMFITNDFAIGLANNEISAKLIFAAAYDNSVDYLSYTVFGETFPAQYGYTLPETQVFQGNGSSSQFQLTYFNGMANPENAVVEIDGVRQTLARYNINSATNTILFNSPPAANTAVAVTTFNDTQQQYLNTQFGITGSPGSEFVQFVVGSTSNDSTGYDAEIVTAGNFVIGEFYEIESAGTTDFTLIGAANNNIGTVFEATGPGTGTGQAYSGFDTAVFDEELNWLTLSVGNTSQLNINDSLIFEAPTLGGLIAGKVYYVIAIWNSTDFVISEQVGGASVQLFDDTGAMNGSALGLTVAPIVSISNDITTPIAITRATATTSPSTITVDSTDGFLENATVIFKGLTFGDILTDGTVYFVDTIINGTDFTIKDRNGDTIDTLSNDTGAILVEVGGKPAVRVTTSAPHFFNTNTLVRIDGTEGSVQLNGNTYYAHVINDTIFDLYESPYDPDLTASNYPITNITTYTGNGYTWRAGLFYIITDFVSQTITGSNVLVTESTSKLVERTPVIFTRVDGAEGEDIMGGIEQGVTYYIKDILSATQFTISEERDGEELVLYNDSGRITVTQWEQVNTDRLWVTVNGYRVPSSKLKINANNELSILTEIVPGDEVIITSMVPYATPDQEVYLNFVDKTGAAEVYRAGAYTKTWVTEPVYDISSVIYVDDVTKLVNRIVQTEQTPAPGMNRYKIGLAADKRLISEVTVFNITKNETISPDNYQVIVEELSPILQITAGAYISEGDQLVITTLEGKFIYLNGEIIKFNTVDFDDNSLRDLERGVNGTATQYMIPKYTEAFGLLSINRLSSVFYNQTWNSNIFNTSLGDPLQISQTFASGFLTSNNKE
jgi:hypothetical protein